MPMLAVIAPDGRKLEMPEESVPEALQHGYRLPDGQQPNAPAPVPVPVPEPAIEAAPAPRYVPVMAPDGRQVEVPETNLQAAIDAGYEPMVSTGEKVRTALEGAARGVSLGISDLIQAGGAGLGTALGSALAEDIGGATPITTTRGVGVPAELERNLFDVGAAKESLQGIRIREAMSPEIARSSEAAGAIGAALLSGGTSGAAQAARFTPAGATSLLAARMQAALATKAAGAAGRIGALAAAGGAEAAAQSAVRRVVDDLAEGNYDLSAERMVSGLGGVLEDATLGALTGGLVGGAIEGSQAAYRMGREMLAGRKAAQAAAEAPDLVIDLSQGPAAAAENAGPLTTRELPSLADNTNSQIVQAARGAAQDFGETQQAAVRSIGDDVDEIMRLSDVSRERAGLAAKRSAAERLTADMPTAERAFTSAREMLEEVELSAKSMTDEIGEAALQDRGGLATLKRIETASKSTARQMVHQLQNGDLGAAYMTLDDFKRVVGQAQNTKNPLVEGRVRSLYERVRTHLEDEGVYGTLAAKQRPVNAAITETIRRSKDDLVRRFFRTSGEAADDPFELLTQSNRESLGSLLNRLGDAELEPTEKALRLYFRSLAVDAETRAAAWGTPELVKQAAQMKRLVGRVESKLNAVGFARQDQKAWEKVSSYATGSAGGLLRGAAKVAQAAVSPVERLAKAAVTQQQAVEKAAEATRSVLLGAAAPRALQATLSVQRLQNAVSQARALQDDSSPESARLRQASLEIAQDDPAFAQVLEGKQRQKAAFLADKAGPAVDDSDPYNPRPMPQDRVSAEKLGRYASAVEDPGAALERIAHGQGSAEDIETMQTVYPRLYDAYVKLVDQQLRRAGVQLTPQQRQHLHRATGLVVAREQQPDYLAFLQQQANAPQGREPPPVPPRRRGINIDPDKHYGSRSDQIMEGTE